MWVVFLTENLPNVEEHFVFQFSIMKMLKAKQSLIYELSIRIFECLYVEIYMSKLLSTFLTVISPLLLRIYTLWFASTPPN